MGTITILKPKQKPSVRKDRRKKSAFCFKRIPIPHLISFKAELTVIQADCLQEAEELILGFHMQKVADLINKLSDSVDVVLSTTEEKFFYVQARVAISDNLIGIFYNVLQTLQFGRK